MAVQGYIKKWLDDHLAWTANSGRVAIYWSSPVMEQQMIAIAYHDGLIEPFEITDDVIYYEITAKGRRELGYDTPAPQAQAERGTTDDKPHMLETLILDYLRLPDKAHSVSNIVTYLYREKNIFFSSDEVELHLRRMLINGQVQLEHDNGVEYWRYLHPAAPQPVTADADTVPTGDKWNDAEDVYTWGMEGGIYKYDVPLQLTPNRQTAQTITELLNTETQALRSQLQAANDQIAALEAEGEQWKQHRELLEATLTSCKQLYDGEQVLMAEKCREVDFMQDRIDDLNQMVDEARQERDSLKARLAECEHAHTEASKQRDAATELYSGKHERIEALKRDLEVARDARKALEYVINHAFKELRSYDGDNGAIIAAKLMLEPYTMPESE